MEHRKAQLAELWSENIASLYICQKNLFRFNGGKPHFLPRMGCQSHDPRRWIGHLPRNHRHPGVCIPAASNLTRSAMLFSPLLREGLRCRAKPSWSNFASKS